MVASLKCSRCCALFSSLPQPPISRYFLKDLSSCGLCFNDLPSSVIWRFAQRILISNPLPSLDFCLYRRFVFLLSTDPRYGFTQLVQCMQMSLPRHWFANRFEVFLARLWSFSIFKIHIADRRTDFALALNIRNFVFFPTPSLMAVSGNPSLFNPLYCHPQLCTHSPTPKKGVSHPLVFKQLDDREDIILSWSCFFFFFFFFFFGGGGVGDAQLTSSVTSTVYSI